MGATGKPIEVTPNYYMADAHGGVWCGMSRKVMSYPKFRHAHDEAMNLTAWSHWVCQVITSGEVE